MRYALLVFHKVVTREPLPAEHGIPMVPLFRGTFDDTEALVARVREEHGRGIFVLTDVESGETEEWNGRTEGGYELVPARECLPADSMGLDAPPLTRVFRIFVVSPKGRREPTPYWVHEIEI